MATTVSCTREPSADSEPAAGTVVVTRRLDAPPEQVWRALTKRDLVARWFGTLEGELSPGAHARFDFGDGDFFQVETLTVEPPQRLEYAWRFLGIGPLDTINWQVMPDGDGSNVTVTDTEPGRDARSAAELRKGWLDFTKRLTEFVARGKPMRYDWRHDFDGNVLLGASTEQAWDALFLGGNLSRWLPLTGGLRPGARLATSDGKEPASLTVGEVAWDEQACVKFELTHADWSRPTRCTLGLSPHGRGTLLSVSHRGWQGIARGREYSKQQRRRFSRLWIEALRVARRLAGGDDVSAT